MRPAWQRVRIVPGTWFILLVIITLEVLFYYCLFGDLILWGRQVYFISIGWNCIWSLQDTRYSANLGTLEESNGFSDPRSSWQVKEAFQQGSPAFVSRIGRPEEGSLLRSRDDKGGPSNEERLELRTADRRGHQAGKGRCATGIGRPAKAASTEERMRQPLSVPQPRLQSQPSSAPLSFCSVTCSTHDMAPGSSQGIYSLCRDNQIHVEDAV